MRGNISEIRAIALESSGGRGVDVDALDVVTPETLDKAVEFAKKFATENRCVVAITGAIDIVTDGSKAWCIFNGNPKMSKVTGTGCQLSAMTAAFVAANPDDRLTAVVAAVCAMGVCGERAEIRLLCMRDMMTQFFVSAGGVYNRGLNPGNVSYRDYIIDAMYNLAGTDLDNEARYEIR